MAEKYTVRDFTVESILNSIKDGDIAIPEIQRPFVWKGRQIREQEILPSETLRCGTL